MARVTLLNQYYAPDEAATAQLASDLGAALSRAGHQVTALASNRSYATPARRYVRREILDGVSVDRLPSTALGRGSALSRMTDYATFLLGATVRLLFGRRPDIVIALTTPPLIGLVALLAARLRRFRVLLWSMDVYPDVVFALGALQSKSISGRLLSGASRMLVRGADATVALGESMATRLRANDAARVEVIHNWADEKSIIPRSTVDHPFRKRWGWENHFVLLYSGNFGLAHDFDTILEAARLLDKTNPRILFAFIGTGPRAGELREAAQKTANVRVYEPVPRSDLGDMLTAADVHLVTLRPQMVGLVVPSKIYGALAAGRPVLYVGPRAGEVYDVVEGSSCGTAVLNGDVAALTTSIHSYAADPAKTSREGERGRQLFDQRFTKSAGTEAFGRLVNELTDRNSSR